MKRRMIENEVQDCGISSVNRNDPTLKKEKRKLRKVLVERKRRERIDKCLDQLKGILISSGLHQGDSVAGGMEKADILELTLRHIADLRSRVKLQRSSGYLACLKEVDSVLSRSSYDDGSLRQQVLQHLQLKQLDFSSDENGCVVRSRNESSRVPLAERRVNAMWPSSYHGSNHTYSNLLKQQAVQKSYFRNSQTFDMPLSSFADNNNIITTTRCENKYSTGVASNRTARGPSRSPVLTHSFVNSLATSLSSSSSQPLRSFVSVPYDNISPVAPRLTPYLSPSSSSSNISLLSTPSQCTIYPAINSIKQELPTDSVFSETTRIAYGTSDDLGHISPVSTSAYSHPQNLSTDETNAFSDDDAISDEDVEEEEEEEEIDILETEGCNLGKDVVESAISSCGGGGDKPRTAWRPW